MSDTTFVHWRRSPLPLPRAPGGVALQAGVAVLHIDEKAILAAPFHLVWRTMLWAPPIEGFWIPSQMPAPRARTTTLRATRLPRPFSTAMLSTARKTRFRAITFRFPGGLTMMPAPRPIAREPIPLAYTRALPSARLRWDREVGSEHAEHPRPRVRRTA
jgi:hypothetical protein